MEEKCEQEQGIYNLLLCRHRYFYIQQTHFAVSCSHQTSVINIHAISKHVVRCYKSGSALILWCGLKFEKLTISLGSQQHSCLDIAIHLCLLENTATYTKQLTWQVLNVKSYNRGCFQRAGLFNMKTIYLNYVAQKCVLDSDGNKKVKKSKKRKRQKRRKNRKEKTQKKQKQITTAVRTLKSTCLRMRNPLHATQRWLPLKRQNAMYPKELKAFLSRK